MVNPARFKTRITKLIRAKGSNAKTLTTVRTLMPIEESPNLLFASEVVEPELIAKVNRTRRRNKGGKRLRLIQVDQDGVEIPEMAPTTRRRVNKRSILKCNKVVSTLEQLRDSRVEDKNICVLFTNFTSEGDYINDHDYLINPYIRNKMFYRQANIPVCICLLCDLIHQAKDHIDHMKSHKTMCEVCRVDFHNAFILNLHVRCHSTYCSECDVTVSYAGHYPHAQEHNRSVTLSNIDIPKVVEEYLYKPEALPSRKEKEPPPTNKQFMTLKELLNEPILDDKISALGSSSSSSPSISPRRSRRITRSRKLEIDDPSIDEEEACIYDKTTKSFITPSAEKQQKLLEQCSSNKEKTESTKNSKEANIAQSDEKDQKVVKNNETEISDIHKLLLCDESIAEKPETEILNIDTVLATEATVPVHSTDISKQQNVITKMNPKKYTSKKRRRIFSIKRKKKVKNSEVSSEPQGNNEEASENLKSANSKTSGSSTSDVVPDSKSDLEETDQSKTTVKDEESGVSQDLEQKTIDSSNIETSNETQGNSSGKKLTMRKRIDGDLRRCSSSKDGKSSVNKLTAKIVKVVRSYSRPNRKRKRVGDNQEVANVTPLVGSEMEPTPTQPQGPDIKEVLKDINIVEHSTTQSDASLKDVGKKPRTLKRRKKTESPVTLSSEPSQLISPPNSLVKTKSSKKSDAARKESVAESTLASLATATNSLVKRSVKASSKKSDVSKPQIIGASSTESTASGTNSESSILSPSTSALVKRKSVKADSKTIVRKQRKTDSSTVANNPPTNNLVKTKSVRGGSKKSQDSNQRKPEPPTVLPITTDNTVSSHRAVTPETRTESAQAVEVKSPLRGDLKIKIKSLKYNPFVSLANLGGQMPNVSAETLKTESKTMSKTCDRTNRKRKRDTDDSGVIDPTPLVQEKGIGSTDNGEMQEALSVTVDVQEAEKETPNEGSIGKVMLQAGDDNKIDLKSNTGTGRKARSSRSRGSLGLVEGLKFPEKRSVSKRPKKPEQDSVDLDASRSTNADLNESSGLESFQSDGVSLSGLEASQQAEDATSNESIAVQKLQLEEPSATNLEPSPSENEKPIESSIVDLTPLELKNVESNDSITPVDDSAVN